MTRIFLCSILFHQKQHWFGARWCRCHNLLLCWVVFCFLALEQCFICATSKPHPLHPLILWGHFTNKCHSKFCTTNLSICYFPYLTIMYFYYLMHCIDKLVVRILKDSSEKHLVKNQSLFMFVSTQADILFSQNLRFMHQTQEMVSVIFFRLYSWRRPAVITIRRD